MTWDRVELIGTLGLAPSRVQESSEGASGGGTSAEEPRAATSGSGGEVAAAAGHGGVAPVARLPVDAACAGPKMMVSRSFSASWIWYSAEILPSSSMIFSAKRAQLRQLDGEVSGAIGCC